VAPRDARPRDHFHSAFWKYWAASGISAVGSGITAVALPLLALTELEGSNVERIAIKDELIARNGLLSGTYATTNTAGPALNS
jgi:hypothetical protein